jgi:hypothetical protein
MLCRKAMGGPPLPPEIRTRHTNQRMAKCIICRCVRKIARIVCEIRSVRRLQGRSGLVQKISPPPESDTRTFQPRSESLFRLSYPGPVLSTVGNCNNGRYFNLMRPRSYMRYVHRNVVMRPMTVPLSHSPRVCPLVALLCTV